MFHNKVSKKDCVAFF